MGCTIKPNLNCSFLGFQWYQILDWLLFPNLNYSVILSAHRGFKNHLSWYHAKSCIWIPGGWGKLWIKHLASLLARARPAQYSEPVQLSMGTLGRCGRAAQPFSFIGDLVSKVLLNTWADDSWLSWEKAMLGGWRNGFLGSGGYFLNCFLQRDSRR